MLILNLVVGFDTLSRFPGAVECASGYRSNCGAKRFERQLRHTAVLDMWKADYHPRDSMDRMVGYFKI